MQKTKIQLEAEIKELRLELENQTEKEQYSKAAKNLRDVYDSYVEAGFTEEQSWDIVMAMLPKGG